MGDEAAAFARSPMYETPCNSSAGPREQVSWTGIWKAPLPAWAFPAPRRSWPEPWTRRFL